MLLQSGPHAKKLFEFHVFEIAGEDRNISESRVKDDFKLYLLYGEIPHYVRHRLRAEGRGGKGK